MSNSTINDMTSSGSDNNFPLLINKQAFADLILNFLGKKEKLTYNKNSDFLIRLNDIEQFHYLLTAKIEKEQYVFIDHFSVTFEYNDRTSRTINGIESLNKFIETRDVIPYSVSMSWNIILKYPNSETLANQQIECSFVRDVEKNESNVLVLIKHTNQAWSIEVLNLFKDKIGELLTLPDKKMFFFKKAATLFNKDSFTSFLSIIILFFLGFSFYNISTFANNKNQSKAYEKLIDYYLYNKSDKNEAYLGFYAVDLMTPDDLKKISNQKKFNKQVNIILEDLSLELEKSEHQKNSYFWDSFILMLSLSGIFIAISFYVGKAVEFYGNTSFILLSKRSENEYNDYQSSKIKSAVWFYSFGATISGAIAFLAKYTYSLLT